MSLRSAFGMLHLRLEPLKLGRVGRELRAAHHCLEQRVGDEFFEGLGLQ